MNFGHINWRLCYWRVPRPHAPDSCCKLKNILITGIQFSVYNIQQKRATSSPVRLAENLTQASNYCRATTVENLYRHLQQSKTETCPLKRSLFLLRARFRIILRGGWSPYCAVITIDPHHLVTLSVLGFFSILQNLSSFCSKHVSFVCRLCIMSADWSIYECTCATLRYHRLFFVSICRCDICFRDSTPLVE